MTQPILVIGGAGYIGAHICKHLAAMGETPVVLDNLSSGHREAVRWGPFVEADLSDDAALRRVFEHYAPRAVMHFAAFIEVGEGEREPLRFWRNNVSGVVALLAAMAEAQCQTLVFSSTCATYGLPDVLPITEATPQQPISVYGRTKLAVEQMLRDVSAATALAHASLRYFNAAGASPDGEIGEDHDPETHLIPNALKAAAGLGGPMALFGDDYETRDGTALRDYIHVMDLAAAHYAALKRLEAGHASFACNLGSGHGSTVREILRAVEVVTGRPVPHTIAPRRAGDAPALLADISQARALIGFAPQRSDTETIIADAWAWHRARWGVS